MRHTRRGPGLRGLAGDPWLFSPIGPPPCFWGGWRRRNLCWPRSWICDHLEHNRMDCERGAAIQLFARDPFPLESEL